MVNQIDKYTAVQLSEYKGTYQLMEGYVNKDGDFKPSFCKREMGPNGERVEKTLPVNVKLGDRKAAIKLCQDIILELTGTNSHLHQEKVSDDVPF